jgi:hypothetical protein
MLPKQLLKLPVRLPNKSSYYGKGNFDVGERHFGTNTLEPSFFARYLQE